VVPEVIDQDAGPRPIVRFAAGLHRAIDVDLTDAHHADEPVAERATYRLRHYDELERLRTPSGKIVSMFLNNGLVRGAGRLEGALCAPLGMLSAGQPRQRGTMLLHWDQYDFDDPKLFETALRWPDDF
jgi:hypothetical protein